MLLMDCENCIVWFFVWEINLVIRNNCMNIGIYIYDDVEVFDFLGLFEVFSIVRCLVNNDW